MAEERYQEFETPMSAQQDTRSIRRDGSAVLDHFFHNRRRSEHTGSQDSLKSNGMDPVESWRKQERDLIAQLRNAIERYCLALMSRSSDAGSAGASAGASNEAARARSELEALEAEVRRIRREYREGNRY
jgi:hypothetical protein